MDLFSSPQHSPEKADSSSVPDSPFTPSKYVPIKQRRVKVEVVSDDSCDDSPTHSIAR